MSENPTTPSDSTKEDLLVPKELFLATLEEGLGRILSDPVCFASVRDTYKKSATDPDVDEMITQFGPESLGMPHCKGDGSYSEVSNYKRYSIGSYAPTGFDKGVSNTVLYALALSLALAVYEQTIKARKSGFDAALYANLSWKILEEDPHLLRATCNIFHAKLDKIE